MNDFDLKKILHLILAPKNTHQLDHCRRKLAKVQELQKSMLNGKGFVHTHVQRKQYLSIAIRIKKHYFSNLIHWTKSDFLIG